jgi:leucyl-tRNA synthetase
MTDRALDPNAYDPTAIETRWQERWERDRINHTDVKGGPRPYYTLMMFPYPSAEG